MDSLTETFCQIDDFCRLSEPPSGRRLLADAAKTRRRRCELSLSEPMAPAVLFRQLRFRQSKSFRVCYARLRREFPRLPGHKTVASNSCPAARRPPRRPARGAQGRVRGASIIDATGPLAVCDNTPLGRRLVVNS